MQNNLSMHKKNFSGMAGYIAVGVFIAIAILLFILENNQWTPIYIPSAPWHANHIASGFEIKVNALIIISFLTGSASVSLLWHILLKTLKNELQHRRNDITELKQELQKTEKLITSSENSK
jgi:hypothetical protein